MPYGRNVKAYGRPKIVKSDVNHFDKVVMKGTEQEERKYSPFASSDSSQNSSLSRSNTQQLDQSSLLQSRRKERAVRACRRRSKSIVKTEPDENKTSFNISFHHSCNSGHSLFADPDSMVIPCTPDAVRGERKPLKELNSQPANKGKEKGKRPTRKNRAKTVKEENTSKIYSEKIPDFDSINQDDLMVESDVKNKFTSSTPNSEKSLKKKRSNQQLIQDGHKQSYLSKMSPIVSELKFNDSNDSDIVNVTRNSANVTKRDRARKKKRNYKESPSRSSDSGNLSGQEVCLVKQEDEPCNIPQDITGSSSHEKDASECGYSHSGSDLFSDRSLSKLSPDSSLVHSLQNISVGSRARKCKTVKSPSVTHEKGGGNHSLDISSDSVSHERDSIETIAEEDEEIEEEEDEEEDEDEEEEEDEDEEEEEHEMEEEEEDYESEEMVMNTIQESNESEGNTSTSTGDCTRYELKENLSFFEKVSNSSFCKDVEVTAEQRVMSLCGQTEPITFSDCIPPRMMAKCVKIGEGVYGEVFRTFVRGESVALKIIPIEGDIIVNDCPQKKFEEILPEIVIAKELSDLAQCETNSTENFCQVNRISCVKGEFPQELLAEWDVYSQKKCSENDRPDVFTSEQLFIVFEFVDGGGALENFQFANFKEALSVLRQVVFALAVAEKELEFEHRDLHIGNVLVRSCREQSVTFTLSGREVEFPTEGVVATIIDFTISRLKKDGCAVFCDISTDDGLFEGTGDFQFDVYRDMRTENGNNWQSFCPHSNVLWVNYLCKKLVTAIRYKENGRNCRDVQRHLKCLVDSMLDYSSCVHLTEDTSLWDL